MCIQLVVIFILISLQNAIGGEFNYSEPVKVLNEYLMALENKKADEAVSKIDFLDQAKRMNKRFNLIVGDEEKSLNDLANELRREYKKQLVNGNFPDYLGVKCSNTLKKKVDKSRVIITQICDFKEGVKSTIR